MITEESSEEYEENQVPSEAEEFQMADTQIADFSDAITEEDTDAVGVIRPTVIPANNAEVTGTIKRQLAPDYYRIDLTTGGTLTLKGSKTGNANFYGTLMDAVTDKEIGTFDKRSWQGDCLYDATFELAKGSYLIKIDNGTSESSTETYVINPKATSIQSVKGFKKGFQVNIKAQSRRNATGYQVQYSTRTDFSNAKTINVSGTAPQIKGLKGKTNYYVRIRVYKKSGKKTYYSSWSSATRVKTK